MIQFMRVIRRLFNSASIPSDLGVKICADLNARIAKGGLPKMMGIRIESASPTEKMLEASMRLQEHHLAPNGYCHGGSVVSLADTAAGAATYMCLPRNAKNFTTIELKSNFVGTALEGMLTCRVDQLHAGKSTQLWNATVVGPCGKVMAHFRATQLILY